jgi:toxin ParE1/3/4
LTRISFTETARSDLGEIYQFIAQDNIAAAIALRERLQTRWRSLAVMPRIGSKRDSLKPELRSVAEGNYVIYYRFLADEIQIIRVLHAARDSAKALTEFDD